MAGSVNCTEITANWQPFINAPAQTGALHIWHVRINDLLHQKDQLSALLTREEHEAATRYRLQKHQDRYIIQHGLLRFLLGWYLDTLPYTQPFTFGAVKKPYLKDNACFFNISHTEGNLLLSIGNIELGVDIEYIKPDFNYQDIASHYFGPAEQQFIAQAKDPRLAFFLLWTRKEALLKSSGLGIDDHLPLIPALEGEHKLPAHFGPAKWQTQSFLIGDMHIGSLTYPAGEREVRFWEIDGLNDLELI